MSGIDYLLDTNFILGMLKSTPEVLAVVGNKGLMARQCAFSAVTRMELLGYPGITAGEDALIRQRLAQFAYLPISAFIGGLKQPTLLGQTNRHNTILAGDHCPAKRR